MFDGKAFIRRSSSGLSLALILLTGCAAFHPMKGIPARYVPDEMKSGTRNDQRTIDLSLLSQDWDRIHRVDGGDLLAIYIGGVIGKKNEVPQVLIPQNSEYQPAAGVPVPVREDGTISLPMIGSLSVRGLTMRETENAIRRSYENSPQGKEYFKEEQHQILVSLQRPRQTRVLVVRQDSRTEPMANTAVNFLNIGTAKRGTGKVVSLPAYSNDVLNALIASDGLPGLDAENAVYIIRRNRRATGPDPVWTGAIDPAELIRQSKRNDEPVIRGQNEHPFDGRGSVFNSNAYFSDFDSTDAPQYPSPSRFSHGQPFDNEVQPVRYPTPLDQYSDRANPSQQPQFVPSQRSPQRSSPQGQPQYFDQPAYQNPQQNDQQYNGPAQYAGLNSGSNMDPRFQAGMQAPILSEQSQWQQQQAPMNGQPQMGNAGLVPGHSNPVFDPNLPNGPQSFAAGNGQPLNDAGMGNGMPAVNGASDGTQIIRIPIRLGPGEHIDIRKEDVILQDGDIVFIESRDSEVFFTGGLLGGGQFTLPRDFDLNILEALSIAGSRQGASGASRSIGGVSSLNSDVTIGGSSVVIIRKLPDGGEIPIQVNLYQARSDPSERIVIQPGDYIYLQYTPIEAIGAFIDRHLLEGALFAVFTQNSKL